MDYQTCGEYNVHRILIQLQSIWLSGTQNDKGEKLVDENDQRIDFKQ